MFDVFGRVALVTGASRGIGRAIATRLSADGADVALFDQADPSIVASMLTAQGGRSIGVRGDVSSQRDVQSLVSATLDAFGRIDILVNNAAMTAPPLPFEQLAPREWMRMMEVNTLGALLCCQGVIGTMRSQRYGRIINIVSDTPLNGVPYMLHYVSSKGAMIAFTRALSREVGKDGINVNALAPGFTLTERIVAQTDRVEAFRRNVTQTQLAIPRDELPEDLEGAASFLASGDSAFMTGQTLVVNGGLVMV